MFSVFTEAYLDGRETEDGGDVEADVDAEVAGHRDGGVGRAGLDPDVLFPGWAGLYTQTLFSHPPKKRLPILPPTALCSLNLFFSKQKGNRIQMDGTGRGKCS